MCVARCARPAAGRHVLAGRFRSMRNAATRSSARLLPPPRAALRDRAGAIPRLSPLLSLPWCGPPDRRGPGLATASRRRACPLVERSSKPEPRESSHCVDHVRVASKGRLWSSDGRPSAARLRVPRRFPPSAGAGLTARPAARRISFALECVVVAITCHVSIFFFSLRVIPALSVATPTNEQRGGRRHVAWRVGRGRRGRRRRRASEPVAVGRRKTQDATADGDALVRKQRRSIDARELGWSIESAGSVGGVARTARARARPGARAVRGTSRRGAAPGARLAGARLTESAWIGSHAPCSFVCVTSALVRSALAALAPGGGATRPRRRAARPLCPSHTGIPPRLEPPRGATLP